MSIITSNSVYWLIVLSLLTGCQQHNIEALKQEPFILPESFEDSVSSQKIILGWLELFDDEKLNETIRIALKSNFNLRDQAQQLQIAIANAKATNANLYPELTAGLQRNRQKHFVIDDNNQPVAQYSTEYQTALSVSWEIDLWGKLSDRSRAALLDSKSQAALYQSARLSLAANVAQSWFNQIESANQLALSLRQLGSLEEALDIVENNYRAGLNSAVDVYTARSDLEIQKASVAQFKDTLEQINRSLNGLLGKYPSSRFVIDHSHLPTKYTPVPAGLPSELLLRRPDIIAARLNWKSQEYTKSAAKKDRYPSFNLTGNLGESSNKLSDLLDSDDLFWSLVSGVTQPVFNAGRLKSLEQSAQAQARQAFAQYSNTILTALTEVENALASEQYLLVRYQTTKNASQLAESAYQLALERYQSGLSEYVNVLTNQRLFFSADSSQISLYNALIQNRISLHLALGGDFFTLSDDS